MSQGSIHPSAKNSSQKNKMDQIKKFIDFLSNSYPRRNDEERHSFQKSNYVILPEITQWWVSCCSEFAKYVYKSCDLNGYMMFTFVKSCQYTDYSIEQSEGKLRYQLTMSSTRFSLKQSVKLMKEIKELRIELNELKEHNKCLSDRILSLESKQQSQPPLIFF
jgi:hypothetical protein